MSFNKFSFNRCRKWTKSNICMEWRNPERSSVFYAICYWFIRKHFQVSNHYYSYRFYDLYNFMWIEFFYQIKSKFCWCTSCVILHTIKFEYHEYCRLLERLLRLVVEQSSTGSIKEVESMAVSCLNLLRLQVSIHLVPNIFLLFQLYL